MKSKITIDVDYNNNPIIKIEHVSSPDVRDKLVGHFLDQFRGESQWARFLFDSDSQYTNRSEYPNDGSFHRMGVIWPIGPFKLKNELPKLEESVKNVESWPKEIYGGEKP